MNWTKTPPTKPGDYRNREDESSPYWVIEVRRNESGQLEGRLTSHLTWHLVSSFEGEWSGPLVPVEEVEKAWMEGEAAGWTNANSIPERQVKFEGSRAHKIVRGEQV